MATTHHQGTRRRRSRSNPARVTQADVVFLRALPVNVDLDLAQVSAATEIMPRKARAILNHLVDARKVESVDSDLGTRFRKLASG